MNTANYRLQKYVFLVRSFQTALTAEVKILISAIVVKLEVNKF